MQLKLRGKTLVAGLAAGMLIGGGLATVTPAGAVVEQAAAAINWKNIWKTEIKPRADKRYYTKKLSNARYYTKKQATSIFESKVAHDQSLLNYYTKAQSDANYYSKSEIDAKLAPFVNSVASFAGGEQIEALTGTDEVVRSVSLLPPRNGTVIVSSSGFFRADAINTVGRCSITTGVTIDSDFHQIATLPTTGEFQSIGGTRGFSVTQGNLLTVNLVCDLFSGTGVIEDTSLSAIFAPS